MDAVELLQAHERMCAYYQENCGDCPLCHMDSCGMGTKNPELLVDIVRKWTAEHCEVSKADESRNVLELMVALTDKVDRMAEKIANAERKIDRNGRTAACAFCSINDRAAEMRERISKCEQAIRATSSACAGGETERKKKKRTRTDVLVEAFPEAVCDAHGVPCACPRDFGFAKCGGGDCVECRREHWCAEVGD